jgi:1-acyl-sn-glycerol-3-phosphate acyltransferase
VSGPGAALARARPVAPPPRSPIPHHLIRLLVTPWARVYFRLQSIGLERLSWERPFILAPNHVSMLDWGFISYFLPRQVRFVVDRSYYEHPLMGMGLRVNGAIPVSVGRPDLASQRMLRAVLAAGEPLILFPEGRISTDGRPGRAHPGVVSLAAATGTPIVPVAVRGAFDAFPRWVRVPRPRPVTVVFGSPLAPPPPAGRAEQQRQVDALMARITALLDGDEPAEPPW